LNHSHMLSLCRSSLSPLSGSGPGHIPTLHGVSYSPWRIACPFWMCVCESLATPRSLQVHEDCDQRVCVLGAGTRLACQCHRIIVFALPNASLRLCNDRNACCHVASRTWPTGRRQPAEQRVGYGRAPVPHLSSQAVIRFRPAAEVRTRVILTTAAIVVVRARTRVKAGVPSASRLADRRQQY
jgi:hypothetical protein